MSPDNLKEILQGIQAGKISPDEALEKLKTLPFENLGFAHLDHHRQLRTGIPEVIYCEGKSKEQLHTIIHKMSQAGATVLGTRLSPEVIKQFPILFLKTLFTMIYPAHSLSIKILKAPIRGRYVY